MKKFLRIAMVLAMCASFNLTHGKSAPPSALNSREFSKYWKIESESPDYKLSFHGDTAEIVAPKGLTLWRKEKMKGKVTVEYDACVVVENETDRLSDLNCFWMASDPKHPDNLWKREKWRNGVFLNCYSLSLYYLGYGGNYNSTTRFRRYDGDERGVTDAAYRPSILKEYTDSVHLLQPNRWYHVKLTSDGRHVNYYIDGERLVDFRDPEPLTEGWFGFRTTASRTRIANFRYTEQPLQPDEVPLHWVGDVPQLDAGVTFGVPFDQGAVTATTPLQLVAADGSVIASDNWPLAYWPDGSVKWSAVAATVPGCTDSLSVRIGAASKNKSKMSAMTRTTDRGIEVIAGDTKTYIPLHGPYIVDSIVRDGVKVAEHGRLVCGTQSTPVTDGVKQVGFTDYESVVKSAVVERDGANRALVRIDGMHRGGDAGREWLPFTVRLYFYAGSPEIKMVHSIVYDGDQNADFIRSLGVSFDVPMREALYNRHVAFTCGNGGVWSEPVQPLVGRRRLTLAGDTSSLSMQQRQMAAVRIPDYGRFDERNRVHLDNWASWDGYRLSQLNADGFSVRKRATADSPWLGTMSGLRSDGTAFAGDLTGGLMMHVKDFWQSYPSSIEVSGARGDEATLTAWLWSPEAEPMDLRHYDVRPHGLESSYEDVQEGMSTPYGVARTSTIVLVPSLGYKGKKAFADDALTASTTSMLLPTPAYLHDREAFGIWSLPDTSNARRAEVEKRLEAYTDFYKKAIDENRWYGFWNYGDVMHAYDPVRHSWMYDVGGFAWDNTELGSNLWLWYSFLRTGRHDLWLMAEAMTRHNSEVDVYHIGPNAGLGSRHNVSHWGCGAKEARISQAAFNRFYHYLTGDERCGDLMSEVTDSDQKLYTIDPMRLAQPRDQYPCTAPARLRFGPDWLAYAGNWMTEWERTGNTAYRDKIRAGMKSICDLPSGLFTGPLALGYDPATGIITTECDPKLQTTNHLMTIMGGFEIMNEMMEMIPDDRWAEVWLDHAANYKQKARELTRNKFRVSRLMAYAAWKRHDDRLKTEAWQDLMTRLEHTEAPKMTVTTINVPEVPAPQTEMLPISTNDAALWSLDAIYMQEVIPMSD